MRLGVLHVALWVLTMILYGKAPSMMVTAVRAAWVLWTVAAMWAVRVVWLEQRRCRRVNNITFDWSGALAGLLGILFLGRIVTIVGDLAMLPFYLDAIHLHVDK